MPIKSYSSSFAKKLEKLNLFDDELIFSEVFLRVEKSDTNTNKVVEVKVNTKNKEFFASKQCESFEQAIDLVQDALKRQVKKNKERKR